MINSSKCKEIILVEIPEFAAYWNAYIEEWGPELSSVGHFMSAFGSYVFDLMAGRRWEHLPTIFMMIEQLLEEGDQEVRNAVTTQFLEDIQNRIGWEANTQPDIAAFFVSLLGARSGDYCIAWDKFTGVKTLGLYRKASELDDV